MPSGWARIVGLAKANNDLARRNAADRDRMRAALVSVQRWLDAVAECDPSEIVADGGVTSGMVICQEAREQSRRLNAALSAQP